MGFRTNPHTGTAYGSDEHDLAGLAGALDWTGDYLPRHTSLTRRVYPGLGHGIGNAEIADVRDFLASHVGADAVAGR